MNLVTGGAGFIGAHLVRQLLEAGERVRVFDRQPPREPGAEFACGDIRNRAQVRDAVRGCRFVYHLAANPQLWALRRGDFHAVNFLGAKVVLEESLAAGAERVLHCSTESILTRARHVGPIAEDVQVRLVDVIGPYCRSKFFAERFAFGLAAQGAPVVVVNPTLPVGPGDFGLSPPTRMMRDFCAGGRTMYLDAELNLIDVRDVALGMRRAMSVGVPGRRYLLGAENWSVKRVFDFLAAETGLPPPRWRVPYGVALVAAYASELYASAVTGEVPAATVTGVKLTRRRMQFDASRSLAELGVVPRPVATTLREVFSSRSAF